MPDLETLNQKHPWYTSQMKRWARYRAFTSTLDDNAEKKAWLPQGHQESDEAYRTRIGLTHQLGWSRAAVRRMSGSLTKAPVSRDYDGYDMDTVTVATLEAFDLNATGTGVSLDAWWRMVVPEALTMGIAFAVIDRMDASEFVSREDEVRSPPFVQLWKAEEVINWSLDAKGLLDWAVLSRVVSDQARPDATRRWVDVFRILDRNGGIEWEVEWDPQRGSPKDNAKPEVRRQPWVHGLGVVPVAPIYAHQVGPMMGASYIDEITVGDWRNLQLESDQSHASYLHGSPLLKIKTTRQLNEVGVGASQCLKLNPETGEDADYLTVDAAGMEIREDVIERTTRQALNSAGIDPQSVVQEGSTSRGRSGVAIAWGFSTAEEPLLNTFTVELDAGDALIHERVARYVATNPGPADQRTFTGQIVRTKKWDLMSASDAVELGLDARLIVKSETWEKAVARDVANKVPGNLQPDILNTIYDEIEAADYSRPEPPVGSLPTLGEDDQNEVIQ